MTQNINPIKIITQTIEPSKIDIDHAIWYVLYCHAFSDIKDSKTENHHILPRKLFPEYVNLNINSWNSASLPKRNHIIAHYILAKAIKVQATLAAFNMMKRALTQIDDITELATLYEEYRESFSNMFSKINKGRKATDETRKKLSEATKGTVPVFDPNYPDHIFRVETTDKRYISGELLHNATGRIHDEMTKQLISENGIKDRIKVFEIENPNNTIYITRIEHIPEGYSKGDPKQVNIAKNRFTDAAHWHNPITGEEFRLKSTEHIPIGSIKGRHPKTTNPFTGTIFRKNFKTNEITTTKELKFDMWCGAPTAKNAFIFDGKISFNIEVMLKHFPTKLSKSMIHKLMLQEPNMKIYHSKASIGIRDYLQQFTHYNEIPLQILPISEVINTVNNDNWLQ